MIGLGTQARLPYLMCHVKGRVIPAQKSSERQGITSACGDARKVHEKRRTLIHSASLWHRKSAERPPTNDK